MENFRIIRVNELLKRTVSEYLHNTFTSESVSITITKVETMPNLKGANVYFSVYDPKMRQSALQFLKKVRNPIQFGVGKMIRLKYMPQLRFVWDSSLDLAHKTIALIDQVASENDEHLDCDKCVKTEN